MKTRKNKAKLDVWELVGTFAFPELRTPDDETFGSLRFVVEIYKVSAGKFAPRLLRRERVNLEPAYGKVKSGMLDKATCEVVIADDSFDWSKVRASTRRAALDLAVKELRRTLRPASNWPK